MKHAYLQILDPQIRLNEDPWTCIVWLNLSPQKQTGHSSILISEACRGRVGMPTMSFRTASRAEEILLSVSLPWKVMFLCILKHIEALQRDVLLLWASEILQVGSLWRT